MTSNSSHSALVDRLTNIEKLIDSNLLQGAADQLNQCIKTAPNDPRIFLLAARLAEASGNPEGALQASRKAYSLTPNWPVTSIHLAETLASRDEKVDSIALARQAVSQASLLKTLDAQLLQKAAGVAYRAGDYEAALQWLQSALELAPATLSLQYQLAHTLSTLGKFSEAIAAFTTVLQAQPGNLEARKGRLRCAFFCGDTQLALADAEALLAVEPSDPVFVFYKAVASGTPPPALPAEYIAQLYDAQAKVFDQSMVIGGKYTLPRDVANLIKEWFPQGDGDVIDFGCGTGLLGVCLGSRPGVLVGVDLSKGMIDQAIQHNVYDKFHHTEMSAALAATPAEQYDVVVALDAMPHLGDLQDVVSNALRILNPGGRLVFSCDAAASDTADYRVNGSLRYEHSRSYVERVLDAAGVTDFSLDALVVRNSLGQAIQGFLVIAEKPTEVGAKKTARKSTKSAKQVNPEQ